MKKAALILYPPSGKKFHIQIEPTLSNLQRLVGGYVEVVPHVEPLCLVVDSEGALKGATRNKSFPRFVGTVLVMNCNDIP